MKNVFISRPNWISSEYTNGLDSFYAFLKTHDLNPRTIGKSDFPIASPLDAVINLLQLCEGAIILGYPQIEVQSGKIKNVQQNGTFHLATEWNHIEAGLAYALGIPILVIHDISITRGIFDRGSLNSFLYQIDLKNSNWPLLPEISGSLTVWKNELRAANKFETKQQIKAPYKIQWGCILFEGDQNLYCPSCYEKDNLKIPTSRVRAMLRECPTCKAQLR